ncbi:Cobalt-zinc-cadmium resistance protein CzcD [Streptococcus oralis]|nr:Cobalt-zinc-cadmium resistance protein CzcD [Streptococcus oralis]
MSSKTSIWLAFFLNLSYAIVEFIAGGIFGSSAVLADSVHDLGDAIAIGISALLETLSNREEDRQYTLGYKRFSSFRGHANGCDSYDRVCPSDLGKYHEDCSSATH